MDLVKLSTFCFITKLIKHMAYYIINIPGIESQHEELTVFSKI